MVLRRLVGVGRLTGEAIRDTVRSRSVRYRLPWLKGAGKTTIKFIGVFKMLPFPLKVSLEISGYVVSERHGRVSVWTRPDSGLSQIAGLIFRERQGKYYSTAPELQKIINSVRQLD